MGESKIMQRFNEQEAMKTDPDREKKIAEAHRADGEKEKAAHRLRRVRRMIVCLEDAEEAWTEWFFGLVVAKEDLTPADLDNIRAIANGFMAEDGRKGRG